jgi:hypothetical protein
MGRSFVERVTIKTAGYLPGKGKITGSSKEE